MPVKLFSLVRPEGLWILKTVGLDFILWVWRHVLEGP